MSSTPPPHETFRKSDRRCRLETFFDGGPQAASRPLSLRALNETLLAHRPQDSGSPLAALFPFWAAENLKREYRFEEAAARLETLGKDFAGLRFGGRPLAPHLGKSLALCQRSLGRVGDAVATLRRVAEERPRGGRRRHHPLAGRQLGRGRSRAAVAWRSKPTARAPPPKNRWIPDEPGPAARSLQRLENRQTLPLRFQPAGFVAVFGPGPARQGRSHPDRPCFAHPFLAGHRHPPHLRPVGRGA